MSSSPPHHSFLDLKEPYIPPDGDLVYSSSHISPLSHLTPQYSGRSVYKHGALSEESIPASLTAKMSTFYLQTPTIAASPAFQQSPVYMQSPTSMLHTPNSLAMSTGPPDQFQASPEYNGVRRSSLVPKSSHKMLEHPPAAHEIPMHSVQLQNSLPEHLPNVQSLQPQLRKNVPVLAPPAPLPDAAWGPGALPDSDLSPPVMYEASFGIQRLPGNDLLDMTIEELLHSDPFSEFNSSVPTSVVKLEDDDALTDFLEFEDINPPAAPQQLVHTPPPQGRAPASGAFGTLKFQSPRQLKKAKSFSTTSYRNNTTADQAFSFEECSSEFSITDKNYSFQDETARLSMQLGNASVTKKKSNGKTPKVLHKPTLRKAKTTTNLCAQGAVRTSQRVLKSMESGLVSFQVNLKNNEQ